MKRLIKQAIPRKKKKEIVLTTKLTFEAFDQDTVNSKAVCKLFKQWVKEHFVGWSDTILQHFLYEYNLPQNERTEYKLTMQMHKIIKDESFIKDDLMKILKQDNEIDEDELDDEELDDEDIKEDEF